MTLTSSSHKVNVYGESLEAKTIAACLAKSGFFVGITEGLSCDINYHEKYLASEPGLNQLLEDMSAVGQLNHYSRKRSDANIHWVVYKGKSSDSLIKFILSLVRGKTEKQHIILTTSLGIGTHETIKLEVDLLLSRSESNEQHEIITIPTFFREGTAISDFYAPQLLLIGTEEVPSNTIVSTLLSDTLGNARETRFMEGVDVEVVNNAISAFLAMRVSFINELSTLLESRNANFMSIIDAMSCDPRFGKNYNQAGCGFGGVALQEAVVNIQNLFKGFDSGSLMMQATLDINEDQKDILFRKFWRYFESDLSNKKVAIWGATFRPDTSSLINSPAINLVNALISESVEVNLYDPMIKSSKLDAELFDGSINVSFSKYEAIKGVDALFIVTDWDEFKDVDFELIKSNLNNPVIFDGRNIYEIQKMNQVGITYFGIGCNNYSN